MLPSTVFPFTSTEFTNQRKTARILNRTVLATMLTKRDIAQNIPSTSFRVAFPAASLASSALSFRSVQARSPMANTKNT